MVLGENLYVMLLPENFFSGFTPKPVSDTTQQTEVLVCVSCDRRVQVDALVASAWPEPERLNQWSTPRQRDHSLGKAGMPGMAVQNGPETASW